MKEWAVWMANKMEEQLLRMEQLRLSEFVAYEKNWKKRLLMQFVGGIARGLGTAVGFTLLGALVVWLLQGLVQRNLPIIGDFLTQLLNTRTDRYIHSQLQETFGEYYRGFDWIRHLGQSDRLQARLPFNLRIQ